MEEVIIGWISKIIRSSKSVEQSIYFSWPRIVSVYYIPWGSGPGIGGHVVTHQPPAILFTNKVALLGNRLFIYHNNRPLLHI